MSYKYIIVAAAEGVDEYGNPVVTETEHNVGEAAAGTTESTSSHDTAESEGIGALGLDVFAIGAQAITFLVLLWLVKKYALDGIVKNLDKRHNDISRGLHLTAEMDKEKAALDEKVEKVLKAARGDADAILAEAKTESGKIIQAGEESATRRADDIIRTAEGKIESDIANARQELKGEMAGLITEATEAILTEKLDSAGDRKLVEKYLSEAIK